MNKKLISSTLCAMLAGVLIIQSMPVSIAYAQSESKVIVINEVNSSPDAPKTGDITNILFWMFVISTVGITLIAEQIKDKKKKTTAIK